MHRRHRKLRGKRAKWQRSRWLEKRKPRAGSRTSPGRSKIRRDRFRPEHVQGDGSKPAYLEANWNKVKAVMIESETSTDAAKVSDLQDCLGSGAPTRRYCGERARFRGPSADLRETDFAFVRLTGGTFGDSSCCPRDETSSYSRSVSLASSILPSSPRGRIRVNY
jgi:hypothetical protein